MADTSIQSTGGARIVSPVGVWAGDQYIFMGIVTANTSLIIGCITAFGQVAFLQETPTDDGEGIYRLSLYPIIPKNIINGKGYDIIFFGRYLDKDSGAIKTFDAVKVVWGQNI